MSKQIKTAIRGCDICVCDLCCAKISESAAITAKGRDYVRYFCGQACYKKWQDERKHIKGE